jgi:hypothetical protein
MRRAYFFAGIAVMSVSPGCSRKPPHPKYSVAFSLTASVAGRKLLIEGATDLPDGAQIAYEVEHEDWRKLDFRMEREKLRRELALTSSDGSIQVEHGRYSKTVDLSGWRAGSVSIWAAFEPVREGQPDTVLQKYGKHGEFLIGPNVTMTNIKNAGPFGRVELTRTVRLAK